MAAFIPNSAANLSTVYTGAATTPLTLMAWFTLGATTPTLSRFILAGEPNFSIATNADGVTLAVHTNLATYTGPILIPNRWYHIAIVCLPSSTISRTFRAFVNGQVFVNTFDATLFGTYTRFTVGNYVTNGNTNPLNGTVRDVRIWPRVMTSGEIQKEMSFARPFNQTGMLLWASLDTDLGGDESGHNRALTNTGGVSLRAGPLNSYNRKMRLF